MEFLKLVIHDFMNYFAKLIMRNVCDLLINIDSEPYMH